VIASFSSEPSVTLGGHLVTAATAEFVDLVGPPAASSAVPNL